MSVVRLWFMYYMWKWPKIVRKWPFLDMSVIRLWFVCYVWKCTKIGIKWHKTPILEEFTNLLKFGECITRFEKINFQNVSGHFANILWELEIFFMIDSLSNWTVRSKTVQPVIVDVILRYSMQIFKNVACHKQIILRAQEARKIYTHL